jgi:hypothetical protein
MIRLPLYALAAALILMSAAEASGRGGGGRGGFCNFCGCKGGPGYRAPDGKCVGKRNITKVCGSPPTTRCKKES